MVGLAADADVTTGAIYHHFGSKLTLYEFVRRDVEQRLIDRMQGAADALTGDEPLGAVLVVGFDFAVRMSFQRILGEPPVSLGVAGLGSAGRVGAGAPSGRDS